MSLTVHSKIHYMYNPFQSESKQWMRLERIITLIEETYYWPCMGEMLKTYALTCLMSQRDKIEQHQPNPLLTSSDLWGSVNYITCLPLMDVGVLY